MELERDMSLESFMLRIDPTKLNYSGFVFASSMLLAVAKSIVSIPKALITLILPFNGAGLSLTSKSGMGSVLLCNLLSASAK